jgi:predicted secreted protein
MELSEKSYKILIDTSTRWSSQVYEYEGHIPNVWNDYKEIKIEDFVTNYRVRIK